jgi:hypothetical protein
MLPTVRFTESAILPPVSVRTISSASSVFAATCVAPKRRASDRLCSIGSTATIASAPACAAP